jgi:hypothetical protein
MVIFKRRFKKMKDSVVKIERCYLRHKRNREVAKDRDIEYVRALEEKVLSVKEHDHLEKSASII